MYNIKKIIDTLKTSILRDQYFYCAGKTFFYFYLHNESECFARCRQRSEYTMNTEPLGQELCNWPGETLIRCLQDRKFLQNKINL